MKKALHDVQARRDREVDNILDTGIQSIEDALDVWRPRCVDFVEPKLGKDGVYFLGRHVDYIRPNTLSTLKSLVFFL